MLIYIEGFDHLDGTSSTTATEHLEEKWRDTAIANIAFSTFTPHGEGYSLNMNGNTDVARLKIPAIYTEKSSSYPSGIIGFHFADGDPVSHNSYPLIELIDSNNNIQSAIRITYHGHIAWYRGTTALYRTKGYRYNSQYKYQSSTDPPWIYVEVLYYISNSIPKDTCMVKIDGQPVLVLPAGTDTQAQTTNEVVGFILGETASTNYHRYYDNLYWASLTGVGIGHEPEPHEGTIDNGGGIYIQTMPPSADQSVYWTPYPGAGDSFEDVDESPPDDDTSYCYTSTTDNKNTFEYGYLSNYDSLDYDVESADLVYGVQVVTRARVDAGAIQHFYHVAEGAGDYPFEPTVTGTTTTSYQYFVSTVSVHPSTGGDWTRSSVALLNWGAKRGEYS